MMKVLKLHSKQIYLKKRKSGKHNHKMNFTKLAKNVHLQLDFEPRSPPQTANC